MSDTLEVLEKELLIRKVHVLIRNIREQTPRATLAQTMRMVAPVLAHLKRRSLAETLRLLEHPHASSASQPHWSAMRGQVRPVLVEIASAYSSEMEQRRAAIYALGWLHRLSRIVGAEEDERFSGRGSRSDFSGTSRQEDKAGSRRQDVSASRPQLPIDDAPAYNPLADAFSRLKQEVPGTSAMEAAPPIFEEPTSTESEVKDAERPAGGKHLLWVTALPGAKPRIETEWGERVPCSSLLNLNIPDAAKFVQEDGSEGLMCLAEVSYKDRIAISARFIRWITDEDYDE